MVHSTVEGRAVRMVLAGPLLGVVLEEGEECGQDIPNWNHYGSLVWADWNEREVGDIGQVVEKWVYTGDLEKGYAGAFLVCVVQVPEVERMVLPLHEDLVWTDYNGRKVEDVGQTGFGCTVTFQFPVSYNDVVQVHKVYEDCTCVESIVTMDVVSWPFVESPGVVQELGWIAVEDNWRRSTVKMLFEEVLSTSEHHKVEEV